MPDERRPAGTGPRGGRALGHVLVVGGGLAGTAAALALADRGAAVTLVEARTRLGGLAFSFHRTTRLGGRSATLTVDNGQHVHLRCCTAYRSFLRRIGGAALAPLQPRLSVPVLDAATGRLGRLARTPSLPVPFHLAPGLARYPHLTRGERMAAARAALALRRLDPTDPALDGEDFAGWLRRHGQSDRCVEALWDLIGVATLNARAADVSLQLAAMVFRTGLLTEAGAADLAVPDVPLGTLHDALARAALARAGVRILPATRARRLGPEPGTGGWRATLATRTGQRELTADRVILAVPPHEAHRLLPPGALPEPGRLARLTAAPIVNLHVVYDRPVLRRGFLAALGSRVQWVFDRTVPAGLAAVGGAHQYLVVSQSAAHEEITRPVGELRERFLPELARLLPAAATARVRDFFVTRERAATFAPSPGVGRLRPGPVTSAPGLYLAGAWTATGWPATMEGAVRSGLAAVSAAVAHRTTLKEST
ncbi:hydroxysqualene dehydroxylase HpnE [Streptomyces sp. 4N509B]|uniref:hydroxysqualene dehydroxylase HpnE n=1 Tax=Streptomyces sp. 4N509B TaxID=3457413 RepID=UPI003FD2DF44